MKYNIWGIFKKIFKCRLFTSPPISWNIWEDIYMINQKIRYFIAQMSQMQQPKFLNRKFTNMIIVCFSIQRINFEQVKKHPRVISFFNFLTKPFQSLQEIGQLQNCLWDGNDRFRFISINEVRKVPVNPPTDLSITRPQVKTKYHAFLITEIFQYLQGVFSFFFIFHFSEIKKKKDCWHLKSISDMSKTFNQKFPTFYLLFHNSRF